MVNFAIIEIDDGLTVIELRADEQPEVTATREGGVLVDPGPYALYEEACDAISNLEAENEERE